MAFIGPDKNGSPILELFGLPKNRVRAATIHFRTDSYVTIDAELFAEDPDVGKLETELKRFHLIPILEGE
jgi:hypothetical protein